MSTKSCELGLPVIRDPVEVMDIAQDAFLKAYRALSGFRGESAFS